ncbi:MAG: hemerythrin domain-containing protein [Woeseiaceae bacterium]|nr:hemerythrin domain-containing protein [Woeseiaceae bacterium]
MSSHEDIDQRTGLPDELCVLLKEYPRATWQQDMTPLAQFWIDKHNDFRRLCAALQAALDKHRSDAGEMAAFANEVAYLTHFLISTLQGHHEVEDHHYFPAFRTADPRLGAGFDVLASDHGLLRGSGTSAIESLHSLQHCVEAPGRAAGDAQKRAADACIEASDLLCRRILRHLDDEEDLVIPLMLAHR